MMLAVRARDLGGFICRESQLINGLRAGCVNQFFFEIMSIIGGWMESWQWGYSFVPCWCFRVTGRVVYWQDNRVTVLRLRVLLAHLAVFLTRNVRFNILALSLQRRQGAILLTSPV